MPFLIVILLILNNNPKIMGRFLNGSVKNTIGLVSLIILIILDVFLLLNFLQI